MISGRTLQRNKKKDDQEIVSSVDLSVPSEIVGVVLSIGPDFVKVESRRVFKVPVPPDVLPHLRGFLIKGSRIGILNLPDGTVKVRSF